MIFPQLEYTLDQIDQAASFVIKHGDPKPIWDFKGEMGAGKTTLISKVCQQLGIEEKASSPTFSIVNEYFSDKKGSIYHFDFYRLESIEEAHGVGVTEYLDSGDLCLLEWSEKVNSLLNPHDLLEIKIETINQTTRKLQLITHGRS